jgi:integrase
MNDVILILGSYPVTWGRLAIGMAGVSFALLTIEARLWIVPPARMKHGREHRVPLSARAVDVVREMERNQLDEFVFPGAKPRKPRSGMALNRVLRRMKAEVTVHGFRSAFRDWAGERTHFPREVAEAALAHLVGNAVERAYRRGDALEKRRKLMDAWSNFLDQRSTAKVKPLIRGYPHS